MEFEQEQFAKLKDTFQQVFTKHRGSKGLLAIDWGFLYQGRQRTDQVGVRVHYFNVQESEVEKIDDPLIQYLFFRLEGIAKKIAPMQEWQRRHEELISGISIGSADTGTLGLVGYDKTDGVRAALTCQHIFKKYRAHRTTFLLQPGPGQDNGNLILDPIGYPKKYLPDGDAALIHLNDWRKVSDKVLNPDDSDQRITSLRTVNLGDRLSKSGRTTGMTTAIVDGIGCYFDVFRSNWHYIEGFRLVPVDPENEQDDEISFAGDSGAVWFDPKSGAGVGLNFAGDFDRMAHYAEFAFAQHLIEVCNKLGFSLSPE